MKANLGVLKSDVDSGIVRLSEYRRENKRKAHVVVVIGTAISAATTVMIAVAGYFGDWAELFQTLALLLSASLTVLNAWDGLYNHKRLWLLQAEIVNRLYELQADIRHLEADEGASSEDVGGLYLRYKSAFREFNDQWKEMRMEDPSNEGALKSESS